MRILLTTFLLLALLPAPVQAENPRVWMEIDRGVIVLELDAVYAPVTTQNFIDYVDAGFFDGLVFHRVIRDFVIQSGGFTRDFDFRDPILPPITSEAQNGLANVNGTIAMALSAGNVNSGQSQFFINLGTNAHLDDDFTVFGRVIMGDEVVDQLGALRTGPKSTPYGVLSDSPLTPPLIQRAVVFHGEFPIMPLHTGSWFDPANPGVGFNVEVANDASTEAGPVLVVYWYDFNEGRPLWLTGTATFEYGATELSVDLLAVPGPAPLADFQTPPPLSEYEVRGSLTVSFSDCRTGRFSYDLPDFGSGEVAVTRLTLPDRASCDGLISAQ
ncbi:MAG: hypothetical protein EA370_14795 [Wenzhouxiangella sp.]|nr:MAG: hypothetical protein EA370_14795 [Wenzhouxiangella sp.]